MDRGLQKSSGGSDPGVLKAFSSRIPLLGGAREAVRHPDAQRGAAHASSRAGSVAAGSSTAPATADTAAKGSRSVKRARCAIEASPDDTVDAAAAQAAPVLRRGWRPVDDITSQSTLAAAPRDAIDVPVRDNTDGQSIC